MSADFKAICNSPGVVGKSEFPSLQEFLDFLKGKADLLEGLVLTRFKKGSEVSDKVEGGTTFWRGAKKDSSSSSCSLTGISVVCSLCKNSHSVANCYSLT